LRKQVSLFQYRLLVTIGLFVGGVASLAVAQSANPSQSAHMALSAEAPYLSQNTAAMNTMMENMTVKPTGNVDRDFVAMMTPHHRGAIDMAQAELLYGHNQQLARIAQGIIVEQLQEVAAMRLALGEPASPTWVTTENAGSKKPQPTANDNLKSEAAYLAQNNTAITTMMNNMSVAPTGDVDHDFVAMMVPHHQGGIDMARAELQHGHNQELMQVAQEIVVDQIQEISMMRIALGEALPPSISSPTGTAEVSGNPPVEAAMSDGMNMSPGSSAK
jgi:uncharacterized protein (DUF305 family)